MSLLARINCGSTEGLLELLKLLVVNNDCDTPWVDCENTSDSMESIIKRLIVEDGEGNLAINVCGCNAMDFLQLTPQAAAPTPASEGMVYAGTDHHLYYHNGSGWQTIV